MTRQQLWFRHTIKKKLCEKNVHFFPRIDQVVNTTKTNNEWPLSVEWLPAIGTTHRQTAKKKKSYYYCPPKSWHPRSIAPMVVWLFLADDDEQQQMHKSSNDHLPNWFYDHVWICMSLLGMADDIENSAQQPIFHPSVLLLFLWRFGIVFVDIFRGRASIRCLMVFRPTAQPKTKRCHPKWSKVGWSCSGDLFLWIRGRGWHPHGSGLLDDDRMDEYWSIHESNGAGQFGIRGFRLHGVPVDGRSFGGGGWIQ